MTSSVRSIPEGYHSLTPYLIVNDAAGAIAFYKQAFGATEVMRMPAPGGRVGHAEVQIGNSRIMLADEFPDMIRRSPICTSAWPTRPPGAGMGSLRGTEHLLVERDRAGRVVHN